MTGKCVGAIIDPNDDKLKLCQKEGTQEIKIHKGKFTGWFCDKCAERIFKRDKKNAAS